MKPILFSTPMVQSINEDRKTQTRRQVPEKVLNSYYDYDDMAISVGKCEGFSRLYEKDFFASRAKYQIGDILWVRETWQKVNGSQFIFKANSLGDNLLWKPSIHMPKEAARIFLKVTNVRVERLQDISEEDAIAEGIDYYITKWGKKRYKDYYQKYDKPNDDVLTFGDGAAIASFKTLWQSINGNWNENPWVFAYDFERTEKPNK